MTDLREESVPVTGFTTSRLLRSFAETVRSVILRPTNFFRNLDGPHRPVIFGTICQTIAVPLALLAAPFNPLLPDTPNPIVDGLVSLAERSAASLALVVILVLVLLPLFSMISVYLGAVFQHLCVMIFVRQRRGFEATLNVTAYTSAIVLFNWLPLIGFLVGLYSCYIVMIGVREGHATTTRRALLAALIPLLIGLASLAFTLFGPQPPTNM